MTGVLEPLAQWLLFGQHRLEGLFPSVVTTLKISRPIKDRPQPRTNIELGTNGTFIPNAANWVWSKTGARFAACTGNSGVPTGRLVMLNLMKPRGASITLTL